MKSVLQLVLEAKKDIENLTPQQVQEELKNGNINLIDIREPDELKQNGKIPGSTNAPRGMLEFFADETVPYHKPEFNKAQRIVLHCASGGRSALAVKTLKEMGFKDVAHLDGGIKAWKEAGLPVG
jgi:rhodanese-related sulfurtransferase